MLGAPVLGASCAGRPQCWAPPVLRREPRALTVLQAHGPAASGDRGTRAAIRRFGHATRACDAGPTRGRLATVHRRTRGVSPGGHIPRRVRLSGLVVAIYSGPACGRHVTFAVHNYVPGARSSAG